MEVLVSACLSTCMAYGKLEEGLLDVFNAHGSSGYMTICSV